MKSQVPSGLRRAALLRCLAQSSPANSAYSPISTSHPALILLLWSLYLIFAIFFHQDQHWVTYWTQPSRQELILREAESAVCRKVHFGSVMTVLQLVSLCSNERQNLSGFWTWNFTSAPKERFLTFKGSDSQRSCWKASRSPRMKWAAGAVCLHACAQGQLLYGISESTKEDRLLTLLSLAAPL